MTDLLIDETSYQAQSFNERARFLVLHYTAGNFQSSAATLTAPNGVSAHYLVPDPTDPTYTAAGYSDMRVFRLVDENKRAWHAGVSEWSGRTNLNDTSIGIEIVNQASFKDGQFVFPPFDPAQIAAVKQLALDILPRYPDMKPVNVIGHSDIAVGRKSDPGPAFPWKDLHDSGIGAWFDTDTQQKYAEQFSIQLPSREDFAKTLKAYGYQVPDTLSDSYFFKLVRAFQLHFRPNNYDGQLDAETAANAYALVEKYFPKKLVPASVQIAQQPAEQPAVNDFSDDLIDFAEAGLFAALAFTVVAFA